MFAHLIRQLKSVTFLLLGTDDKKPLLCTVAKPSCYKLLTYKNIIRPHMESGEPIFSFHKIMIPYFPNFAEE